MAEYNYTCGDCLHVQICEGDPSLRAFDRKNTAYCKAFKNAADVVEVVRCKDCKHRGWVQEPCHGKTVHYCKLTETGVKDNDFCSYGERRSE